MAKGRENNLDSPDLIFRQRQKAAVKKHDIPDEQSGKPDDKREEYARLQFSSAAEDAFEGRPA